MFQKPTRTYNTLEFGNHIVNARFRVAAERGDLVQFDIKLTDGDVTNNAIGDAGSGLANVVTPYGDDVSGLFGIVLDESVRDNGIGRVLVEGITTATVTGSSGSNEGPGAPLHAPASAVRSLITNNEEGNRKHLAFTAVEIPNGSTVANVPILFNGIYGFR